MFSGSKPKVCRHGATVPFRIDDAGEVAVIFIGGEYSHSIRRAALLSRSRSRLGRFLAPERPGPPANTARTALAEQVIRHLTGDSAELLYARVDLVPGRTGEQLILEIELTEPALFLDFSDSAANRLADAIAVLWKKAGSDPPASGRIAV